MISGIRAMRLVAKINMPLLLALFVDPSGAITIKRKAGRYSAQAHAFDEVSGNGSAPVPANDIPGGIIEPGSLRFDDPFVIEEARRPTGYLYLGCMHDSQNHQRHWYEDAVAKEDREPMTPELCFRFCKDVIGVMFFGLIGGDRCYCTPFFDKREHVGGQGDCDMPCTGAPTQVCGGMEKTAMYGVHDETNLEPAICKTPPSPIAHAKTFKSRFYKEPVPCMNAMKSYFTTQNGHCEMECESGYRIHNNNIECMELGNRLVYSWGQLVGSAACLPVSCGVPEKMDHSRSSNAEVHYMQQATYTCDRGFSLDGQAEGPKQQQVDCLPTGQFSGRKPCVKVECGNCSSGEQHPHGKFAEGGLRRYSDVCTFTCDEGYTLDQTPNGQNVFRTSCLDTGKFQESATCRPVKCSPLPDVPFAKKSDGGSGEKIVVYPMTTSYECESGYSLTGFLSGGTKFDLKCQADGVFSDIPECKPMVCGAPPPVDHASYIEKSLVYSETVTYTCHPGFTLSGKAGTVSHRTIACGANGQFAEEAPRCLPVECGSAPVDEHSELEKGDRAMSVFNTTLSYVTAAGYSTVMNDNPWEPRFDHYTIKCLEDGQFENTPQIVNIDDCSVRECGEFGTCKDLPNPTGVALDDYTCECETGYEITLLNSTMRRGELMKVCTNINDCPAENACGGINDKGGTRGSCQDLVNNYSCLCGSGYERHLELPNNVTCVPVECGPVAEIGNATVDVAVGMKTSFDTPAWNYSCMEGYTLDGSAEGIKHLQQKCTSRRVHTYPPTCMPVTCGTPRRLPRANMVPKVFEVFFKEQVHYTCDEGYSLNSKADGPKTMDVPCLSTGELNYPGGDGRSFCKPVECGNVPTQSAATWDETHAHVYGENVEIQCNEGYSIDRTTDPERQSWELPCNSDGTYTTPAPQKCQRVLCNDPPKYPNTTRPEKAYYYEDEVLYKLYKGHTMDGLPSGRDSFKCVCLANGTFDGLCRKDKIGSRRIDCGKHPEVPYATVEGSTLYGEHLTATAKRGYSLDGTPTGKKNFTFACMHNGKFSKRQKFQRIACGLAPEYEHTAEVAIDVLPLTLLDFAGSKKRSLLAGASASRATALTKPETSWRRSEMFAGDRATYTCMEGHRAVPLLGKTGDFPIAEVEVSEPRSLEIECLPDGRFRESVTTKIGAHCAPVTCDVRLDLMSADVPLIPAGAGFYRITYKAKQRFDCMQGFSLDGTPSGDTSHTAQCGADGALSATGFCQDIDYCLISECGDNGKCQDGRFAYGCECDDGFAVAVGLSGYETCVQINECEANGGFDACSVGGGKCVDETGSYKCECNPGYENVLTQSGLDGCSAVTCPALPSVPHASSKEQGQKMSYPQTVRYVCVQGYTLDGVIGGEDRFTVKCLADGRLSGLATNECKPVSCGDVKQVDHANVTAHTLVYGQIASYTCAEGYTTTGSRSGSSTFTVSCTASGVITAPEACEPMTCGKPPTVFNANGPSALAGFFPNKYTYLCEKGHTTTGVVGGSNSFEIECQSSAEFTEVEACHPVTCGSPKVEKGQHSIEKLVYPQDVEVVCDTGYTTNADPVGDITFVAMCAEDGKFTGMQQCLPVSCGKSEATDGATPRDPAKVLVFEEIGWWDCKPGFSVEGTRSGRREFQKQCMADGGFDSSWPSDCVDINYCRGNPCSSNGLCTDGIGAPFPGYTCDCDEGFEINTRADGSQSCAADDCTGNPCGDGGTCTDLSEHASGAFNCVCDDGYELVQLDLSSYTCRRRVCGKLPVPQHVSKLTMLAMDELPSIVAVMPTLRAFDVMRFTCEDGYSTDMTVSPESKDFRVACLAEGTFERDLNPALECQPVACDNYILANADVLLPRITFSQRLVFPNVARVECFPGHTTTGEVGGADSFELPCLANGKFPADHELCTKIKCDVPNISKAVASERGRVVFGVGVTYECFPGYHVADGLNRFRGTCDKNGEIDFESAHACKKYECKDIPEQPNAVVPRSDSGFFFGDSIDVSCEEGLTVGGVVGGKDGYVLSCTDGGVVESSATSVCSAVFFSVRAKISDLQYRTPVEGVTVRFEGYQTVTTTTDANGAYSALLPGGNVTMTVSKAGYITVEKSLYVSGPIVPGQGADADITRILPAGGWRATLTWNVRTTLTLNVPQDLDTHVLFGCDYGTEVWRLHQYGVSDLAGGLEGVFERDGFSGGPEVSTILNAGSCQTPGCCLLRYRVYQYSDKGKLSESGAKVTVFKDDSIVETFTVPSCIGEGRWWDVFTLDASVGANLIFPGFKVRAPYFSAITGLSDWSMTFDTSGWSRASDARGLTAVTGLNIQDGIMLHRLESARYVVIKNSEKPECVEVDVTGKLREEKWAQCSEGWYLNGFFRTGSMYDDIDGYDQIARLECCRPTDVPGNAEWGKCYDEPVGRKDWVNCATNNDGSQTAMVGLHSKIESRPDLLQTSSKTGGFTSLEKEANPIITVDYAKCCAMPKADLLDGGGNCPTTTTTTTTTTVACTDIAGTYTVQPYHHNVTLTQTGCSGSASGTWTFTVSGNSVTNSNGVTGTVATSGGTTIITWSNGYIYSTAQAQSQ